MKFGLFYEMFVPDNDPGAEARIIKETVQQAIHADRHGWDYVWMTEHHFLRGFSHMSAAEVLFGAIAQSTRHIRCGFGLALTPPAYNHPVRIAERVAMLDCLSDGRVDVGTGRSTTPAELYGFGINPDDSRAMWQEGMESVMRLLAEEDVSLDGQFVQMPTRTTFPRPVQRPHPPFWVGGVGPGNAERAARQGLGMLFFALNTTPDALEDSVAAYQKHIGNAEPICGVVNAQTGGFVNGLCGPDRDAVRNLAARKVVEHMIHGSTHMLTGWPDPDHLPQSYAHVGAGDTKLLLDAALADADGVAQQFLEHGFVMAGTPDDCAAVIQSFADVGIDQLIVHMQMGGMPHDLVMQSIELLGSEVLPKFR